jgi:polar amino acid transport system permease protein
MSEFLDSFANVDSLLLVWPLLLQGLELTLLLSAICLPLGLASGLALGVLGTARSRVLRIAVLVWIDLFRAFPVIVLLILIYYGLPFVGLRLPNLWAAVLGLVLNNSGYYGEIFRAGLLSVPAGQTDAARALGLGRIATLRLVLLPQALRGVIAPLTSNSLELVKETAIASMVALPELLRSARVAQEQTYDPTPLTAAAAIYLLLLWPCARLSARLERRMLARRI